MRGVAHVHLQRYDRLILVLAKFNIDMLQTRYRQPNKENECEMN